MGYLVHVSWVDWYSNKNNALTLVKLFRVFNEILQRCACLENRCGFVVHFIFRLLKPKFNLKIHVRTKDNSYISINEIKYLTRVLIASHPGSLLVHLLLFVVIHRFEEGGIDAGFLFNFIWFYPCEWTQRVICIYALITQANVTENIRCYSYCHLIQ